MNYKILYPDFGDLLIITPGKTFGLERSLEYAKHYNNISILIWTRSFGQDQDGSIKNANDLFKILLNIHHKYSRIFFLGCSSGARNSVICFERFLVLVPEIHEKVSGFILIAITGTPSEMYGLINPKSLPKVVLIHHGSDKDQVHPLELSVKFSTSHSNCDFTIIRGCMRHYNFHKISDFTKNMMTLV